MHACSALAVISDGSGRPQYQEDVIQAGGVLPIAHSLRNGDPSTQEAAAAAVASLSQLKTSHKALVKAGTIVPLVTLLKGNNDDTHIHACFALGNFAEDNSANQQLMSEAGAVPLLVGLLGTGKAQEAVTSAVEKLARGNEPNQAEISRLGGVPKLIALLSVVNTETQAQAAAALAAVASGESRDEQDVIAAAGGIRPLLALIESRYAIAQRCSGGMCSRCSR